MPLSLGVSAVLVLALALECSPRLPQPEHDSNSRHGRRRLAGARRTRSACVLWEMIFDWHNAHSGIICMAGAAWWLFAG
jgi:hypothetical protein